MKPASPDGQNSRSAQPLTSRWIHSPQSALRIKLIVFKRSKGCLISCMK